jgi:hypothetical protein
MRKVARLAAMVIRLAAVPRGRKFAEVSQWNAASEYLIFGLNHLHKHPFKSKTQLALCLPAARIHRPP